MNRVEISFDGKPPPAWSSRVVDFAQKTLGRIGRDGWDLSLLFCDEEKIRSLNRQYRGKDESTDVLSFGLGDCFIDEEAGERYLPGDIAISLHDCAKNADNFNVNRDEELRRLLIHGILHLDGQDHQTNDAGEEMLIEQEKLLAELAGERILI